MNPHELLGLDNAAFERVADHLQTRRFEEIKYQFLPDYHRQLERGTVLTGQTAVRGFPKVPRTLMLEGGIARHFEDEIYVEEKLNGYNTRIARIDGVTYGILRSGRICPFTTWYARDRLDLEDIFDAYPEQVLCGEMIGPDNPYTPHSYPGVESLEFRAFDVRHRESGVPMAVTTRRTVLEAHAIPQVEHLATVSPTDGHEIVAKVIEDLDQTGREGIIMKSPCGTKQLKYTTSSANQGDLAFAFSLPFDYGQAFMFRRLIREGFQSVEFDDDAARRERATSLGEAILTSMTDAIEAVDAGERLAEDHAVTAPPAVVDDLLNHLREMGLRLDIVEDVSQGSERHVNFRKIVQSSNDKIDHYLDGAIVKE